MRHADLGGGGDVYFRYDAAGTRVRKVVVNAAGTQTEERLYLGAVELYRERTGTTLNAERQTLHIADDTARIAIVETLTVDAGSTLPSPPNIARYQHANHLSTVSIELDDAANIISYEEFHPYGTSAYRAVDSTIAVSAKRYRYAGKERDHETGLDHMGARLYAPWLARWTSTDPIGLGGGINRYEYASGNPVVLADPSGLAPASTDDSQSKDAAAPATDFSGINAQWEVDPNNPALSDEMWVQSEDYTGPISGQPSSVIDAVQRGQVVAQAKVDQRARARARTKATLAKIHEEADRAEAQGRQDERTARSIAGGLAGAVAIGVTFLLGPYVGAGVAKLGLAPGTAATVASAGVGAVDGATAAAVHEGALTGDVRPETVAGGAAIGTVVGGLVGAAAYTLGKALFPRATPPLRGSGPAPGTLEASTRVRSTAQLQRFDPSPNPIAGGPRAVEFVYDPATRRFLVGRLQGKGSPHQKLAEAVNPDYNANEVVAGMFSRGEAGEIVTSENSGHFGQNWTDALRSEFVEFLERMTDQRVVHETWKDRK